MSKVIYSISKRRLNNKNIHNVINELMNEQLTNNNLQVLNSSILYYYSIIQTSNWYESVFSMFKNIYKSNMSMITLFVMFCYKEMLSKYEKNYNYYNELSNWLFKF